MLKARDRKIVFEDGSEVFGRSFGAVEDKVCELVFNTSPVGYQELISDPSYASQAVVATYPLIGNYGIAEDDFESKVPAIGALLVREYNDVPSNFRSVRIRPSRAPSSETSVSRYPHISPSVSMPRTEILGTDNVPPRSMSALTRP